ncbi:MULTISPECIES: hypothetical protein [Cytobacillus]|uniref:hypothetical protein n=1 Tax=Cytobacillus TaxID=2675230 RepID=UPI00203A5D0C|nr:hypothetical protein [Cytobacillus firmus]MCM3705148.1 hypothetical protein [Cytobacillus firmus]
MRTEYGLFNNNVEVNIDSIIKKIWCEKIKRDYGYKFFLYEDSLKSALYYHIRTELENNGGFIYDLRIYTEYRLPCGRRADIAILKIDLEKAKTSHLKDSVIGIEALIEIKYKAANVFKDYYDDLNKMADYSRLYPNSKLYAAFIQGDYYNDDNCSWLNEMEFDKTLSNKIIELLGYWDSETDAFVTKVTNS